MPTGIDCSRGLKLRRKLPLEVTRSSTLGVCIIAVLLMNFFAAIMPFAYGSTTSLTITLEQDNGGPIGTFRMSSCSISPTLIASDGQPHTFAATNSCEVTIAAPRDTGNSVYRFASGLINNNSATFETCLSGNCSPRTYVTHYERTIFSPDYSLSGWNGGGLPPPENDTRVQQVYEATGGMGLNWMNWAGGIEGCNNANVTGHTHTFSVTGQQAGLYSKYQMPFSVQLPMDGYGGSCAGWATSVVNQYPDLLTYSSTGPVCSGSVGSYTCTHSWVRVDDINLAVQTYNDLVATKNQLVAANADALQYWHAISISSIASDGGTLMISGTSK